MEVMIMPAPVNTSPLFNREMEKSPSPDKEEKPLVLDYSGFEQHESFADEIETIDKEFQVAYQDLPEFEQRKEDGKMLKLVGLDYIHMLMKFPPRPLRSVARKGMSEEKLEFIAAMQTARDIKNDIIRQYRLRGYAYIEVARN